MRKRMKGEIEEPINKKINVHKKIGKKKRKGR